MAVQIAHLQFDLHRSIFEQKEKLESLNSLQDPKLYEENKFQLNGFLVCNQEIDREEKVFINNFNISQAVSNILIDTAFLFYNN